MSSDSVSTLALRVETRQALRDIDTFSERLNRLTTQAANFPSINLPRIDAGQAANWSALANALSTLGNVNLNVANLRDAANALESFGTLRFRPATLNRMGAALQSVSNAVSAPNGFARNLNDVASALSTIGTLRFRPATLNQLGAAIETLGGAFSNAPNLPQNITDFANALHTLSGSNIAPQARALGAMSRVLPALNPQLSRFIVRLQVGIPLFERFSHIQFPTLSTRGWGSFARNLENMPERLRDAARDYRAFTDEVYLSLPIIERAATAFRAFPRRFQQVGNAANGATGRVRGFGGALGGVSLGVSSLISGRAFEQLGEKVLKIASDMEEAQGKFDWVLKFRRDEGLNVVKELGDNYLFSQVDATKTVASLVDVFNKSGVNLDTSLQFSSELTKRAADLAAFTNVEGGVERSMHALERAMLGYGQTARSLGVMIYENDVKTRMATNAQRGLTFETEQAAKMFARYQIIMERSASAEGHVAREKNNLAQRVRVLQKELSDLGVSFGKQLIEPVGNATVKITELVKKFQSLTDEQKKFVATGVLGTGATVAGTLTAATGASVLQNVGGVAARALGGLNVGDGFIGRSISGLGRGAASVARVGGAGAAAIATALSSFWISTQMGKHMPKIAEAAEKLPTNIAAGFKNAWGGLKSFFGESFSASREGWTEMFMTSEIAATALALSKYMPTPISLIDTNGLTLEQARIGVEEARADQNRKEEDKAEQERKRLLDEQNKTFDGVLTEINSAFGDYEAGKGTGFAAAVEEYEREKRSDYANLIIRRQELAQLQKSYDDNALKIADLRTEISVLESKRAKAKDAETVVELVKELTQVREDLNSYIVENEGGEDGGGLSVKLGELEVETRKLGDSISKTEKEFAKTVESLRNFDTELNKSIDDTRRRIEFDKLQGAGSANFYAGETQRQKEALRAATAAREQLDAKKERRESLLSLSSAKINAFGIDVGEIVGEQIQTALNDEELKKLQDEAQKIPSIMREIANAEKSLFDANKNYAETLKKISDASKNRAQNIADSWRELQSSINEAGWNATLSGLSGAQKTNALRARANERAAFGFASLDDRFSKIGRLNAQIAEADRWIKPDAYNAAGRFAARFYESDRYNRLLRATKEQGLSDAERERRQKRLDDFMSSSGILTAERFISDYNRFGGANVRPDTIKYRDELDREREKLTGDALSERNALFNDLVRMDEEIRGSLQERETQKRTPVEGQTAVAQGTNEAFQIMSRMYDRSQDPMKQGLERVQTALGAILKKMSEYFDDEDKRMILEAQGF